MIIMCILINILYHGLNFGIIFSSNYIIMKQNNYQEQNQQLYQLHLERMKRRPKPQIEEEVLSKKVHRQQKPILKANGEIYLNSVIYDKRQNSSKYNNIRLAQFLHEDINQFANKPVSKNVEAILITTYGFQTEVFLPILNTKVPFFIVNKEGEDKEGYVKKKFNGFQNFTLISPPKYNVGYGVFHTKLWLIKFTTFLRVVICTSNHHFYDWTVWQNAFWFQDFPLQQQAEGKEAPKDKQGKETQSTLLAKIQKATIKDFDLEKDFVDTLSWVINEMQPKGFDVLAEMKIDFKNYSFKGIEVILIPSLPGRFKGQYLDKVGLGKVKKVMSKCSIQFKKPIMTYNSTSLGKVDQKFIREVYFAFNPTIFQFLPKSFQLVYPTQRYIKDQTCGEANILFLTKQNYEKSQLRNHIFYKYEQSSSNGVLGGIPHLKTAIVQEEGSESDRCILYMGSHNLTKAAWGAYEKGDTQISCNNSELGLLFINYSKASLLKWLPYKYPPQKYGNNDMPYFRNHS